MEFVYMQHPGVEKPAKVPATAVPHWEGHGWSRTDPPAKPPRPTPHAEPVTADQARDAGDLPKTSTDSAVDTPKAGARSKTTKAAPAGRKED